MTDFTNKILGHNISEDRKISIAVMSSFVILIIQYSILYYFNLANTPIGRNIQILSKGIVGIFYLIALPTVLKRNKTKFIGIYITAFLIFLFNSLLFKDNLIYLKSLIFPFFFTCLPSFIYAYSIDDWNELKEVMLKTSNIVFIIGFIIGIMVFFGQMHIGSYSMSLSYYMLLPTVVYINEITEKKSLKSGLVILVSLFIILALGSRGAIMCIGVFVILKFIGILKGITYNKIRLLLVISSIVFIGFIFLDEIFEYIYNLLLRFGIDSRNIRLFLQDGIHWSGRDEIYSKILKEIFRNPIIGVGLAGDRLILGGRYVHNIFLEILTNFGLVIGIPLIISILYLQVKSLFIKDIEKYNIIIIWISIGFLHLLVSSSYLTNFKFWIYLGLSLKYLTSKNNEITVNRNIHKIALLIRKILNFLMIRIEFYLLTLLNYIIPKSENKVFIFDKRFRQDNVWAISEYLSKNPKYNNYQIYYYTKANIKPKGNIIHIDNGIHAIWMQLRSKYIFYSYTDIKIFKPVRNQIIVNTMHGSPLKNIGYLAGNSKFKKLWRYEKTFTHILCTSNFFKDIIKKSFGASEEQCLVLGYPRNDYIFTNKEVLSRLNIDKQAFNKIFLWMPTWRGDSRTGKNDESNIDFPIININNINYLNEFLYKNNILMMIKPHPIQMDLEILNKNLSNIKILKNEELQEKEIFLYELFNEVDALLTDYSSVYFDFLLTMKPIGFTIDDIESYGDKRGFVVENPLEIMPGKKITNIEELISFISDIKENNDEFYEERKAINDLANKYKDGNSTKRIVEFLGM